MPKGEPEYFLTTHPRLGRGGVSDVEGLVHTVSRSSSSGKDRDDRVRASC